MKANIPRTAHEGAAPRPSESTGLGATSRCDAARVIAVLEELTGVMSASDRKVEALLGQVQALISRTVELEQLAATDPLTGLRNRRGLEEEITREEARARRFGTPMAVVLLDVVGLKAVNDRHGHGAGDTVLQTVARALSSAARASDVPARLGGDEFAVLLLGADERGAAMFLERVRSSALAVTSPDGTVIPVKLRAGAATFLEAGSLAAALALADQRMIQDKGAGSRAAHGTGTRRETPPREGGA